MTATAARLLGRALRSAGRGQRRVWAAAGRASAGLRHPLPLAALLVGHLFGALLLYLVLPIGDPGGDGYLLLLVGLAVVVGLAADPGGPAPAEDTASWWSHARLVQALLDAGVLPRPRPDDPLPALRYRGQVRHDAHGTTVVVELPGQPWTLVRDRADRLAAALRLDGERLLVDHPEGTPSGTVRLFVGNARPEGSTPAEVGSAERSRWSEPVRIGRTLQGHPVLLATDEQNALLAGVPGSGKTSVARIVLASYLLDPTALVYGLDGKGSRKDYGAAVPLCARWVTGVSEDAAAELEDMLAEVLAVVRTRNSADAEPEGGWPGVLLLLEELQDVRAAADRATRDRLDSLLGRVIRMGRAVGVSVLISTQRPSVDDVPAGVRNLVSQRLALMLRNGADAALVLGTTPDLPLPRRRGEALLTTPTGTVAVELDLLDGPAWTALCARAAALRPVVQAQPVGVSLAKPEAPPELVEPVEPEPVLDPLLAEVLALLADGPPRGMPATALLERLPAWLAPATPAALGKALRAHPGHVQPRHAQGGTRVWRAVTAPSGGPPGAVVVPSSPRRPAAVPTPGDGPGGPPHAQTAPSRALLSSPSSTAVRGVR